LKGQQAAPLKIVTDKLRSYFAAKREIMPSVDHSTQQYENNRCELSHQPGRQKERQMRQFRLNDFYRVMGLSTNFSGLDVM
jgi:putative transposase